MTFAEFVIKIIEALAWPLVVIWVVWTLREALARVLERLSKVKGGGVEAEFGNELNRIESEAEHAQLPAPEEVKEPPTVEPAEEKYRRLSDISPAAAVIEGWREIELATAALIAAPKGFRTPIGVRDALAESGILDGQSLRLVEELRVLKNQMTHSDKVQLSSSEAFRYALLASRLAAKIRGAVRSQNLPSAS